MGKKKIGLLTFCDNTNFGSYLQTYGLYIAVLSEGYDIELIDYQKKVPDYEKMSISGFVRAIKQRGWLYGYIFAKNIYDMQKQFSRLISETMKKSGKYTRSNINKCENNYKTVLVGSDLVWDKRYANDYTYMIDFSDTVKKIAYAASCGYESVPNEEKEFFIRYLSKFSMISVREQNFKKQLEDLLNKEVFLVCDPTMLCENSFWIDFVVDAPRPFQKEYVLVYMPDSDNKIIGVAKRYSRKNRLKLLVIGKEDECICPKSPKEFLTLIYYANKVFTGSYHGLLFSLYYKKQVNYINRKPENRIKTVATKLDIEEFEITNSGYNIEKTIDFTKEKLYEKEFREESKEVLRKMLNCL